MCQLLGMSSQQPAAITFSFTGFSARGGLTDHHQDGWGIALFEDGGCRVLRDEKPSVSSPLAELVKQQGLRARYVISHIRKATQGKVSLDNCHPFVRELWGQNWAFAHNGDLKNFAPPLTGAYLPLGDTDSERAFCYMLQMLRQRFPVRAPEPRQLQEAVAELAWQIAAHGIFNFLLSNGQMLLAHSSTDLHYVQRQPPFNRARLVDVDVEMDFGQHNTDSDRLIVVATRALTCNEQWVRIEPGQLLIFADGALLDVRPCCARTAPADDVRLTVGNGGFAIAT